MAAASASQAAGPSSLLSSTARAGTAPGGKQLGTLVVIVYRAKNLPNKQKIGKQDPYCTCTVGHQKQKTPVVKRGGQTPMWDCQLHFEIWEDAAEGEVKAVTTETGGIQAQPAGTTATTATTTPSVASSSSLKGKEKDLPGQATIGRPAKSSDPAGSSSNKRTLRIACYADDAKEPDLIGEGNLDFSSILRKGELDEWVELKNKGKYAGEVFLEMTFYAAGPPPVKRRKKPDPSAYNGPLLASSASTSTVGPLAFPESPAQTGGGPSASGRYQDTLLSPSSRTNGPADHSATLATLRPSQSSLALQTLTAQSQAEQPAGHRPPSTSSNVAFPMPDPHRQSSLNDSLRTHAAVGPSYNPPYAPPSLTHSGSGAHVRNHRVSATSVGLTQHDIDSLTRPMSTISLGSTNGSSRPLPMPGNQQPPPGTVTFPEAGGPYRPHSTGAGETVSYTQPPAGHYPSHSHSNSIGGYSEPQPDLPINNHRHSVATYIPQSHVHAYSSWTGGPVEVEPGQLSSHPVAPDHVQAGLQPSQMQEPFRPQSGSSWHDPRTSPAPQSTQEALLMSPYRRPSPIAPLAVTQDALQSPHPASLQPGLLSPVSPSRSNAGPSGTASIHQTIYASPSQAGGFPEQLTASPGNLSDWRTPSPQHAPWGGPPPDQYRNEVSAWENGQQHGGEPPYGGTTEHAPQYDQHSHQGEPYYQDTGSAPDGPPYSHESAHQHQSYYDQGQAQTLQGPYQETLPPFDGRTSSPYRPLPSTPAPIEPWQGQGQGQYQHQAPPPLSAAHDGQYYDSDYQQQQPHAHAQPQPPPPPSNYYQYQIQDQAPQQQYHDDSLYPGAPPAHLPPPPPLPPASPFSPHQQQAQYHQDYSQPPLGHMSPPPPPFPAHQQHQQHQQHHQPRFGLPPHQPYDPPYIPPGRTPPPVPPVPAELRREQMGSNGPVYY